MQDSGKFDFDQYKKVLGAYKKLNSLITIRDKIREGALENGSTYNMNVDESNEIEDNNDSYILSNRDYISKVEASIHKVCQQLLNEKNYETKHDNYIEEREKEILARQKELEKKEQKMLAYENALKAREFQIANKERQIGDQIAILNNRKCHFNNHLSIESCETVCFIPEKREETRFNCENSETEIESFSREQLEEILKRITEVEEANILLKERNIFLEEELSQINSEINEQKYLLVREREKLISKENSLKCREQTLTNRESRLIENTKFINATIKSVNQYIKSNAETGNNKKNCEDIYQNELQYFDNNTDHLTFRGFLQSLDEIKDFSNLPSKENRIKKVNS